MNARRHLATLGILFLLCDAARGGGGGENMLLVVNPNDPSALQIANAYAVLRDIPANNIVFLAPPPDYLSSAVRRSRSRKPKLCRTISRRSPMPLPPAA